MALLSSGSTEFAESVTRGALHFKSGDLKDFLAALKQYQQQPSAENLIALIKADHQWSANNPAERKARGSKLKELHREFFEHYIALRGYDLMEAGNHDFAESVHRNGLHFQSGRLKRLLKALEEFQAYASDDNLKYLHKRMQRWREENPEEFKYRGALVGILYGMILKVAESRGISFEAAAAVASSGPGDVQRVLNSAAARLNQCKVFACNDAGKFKMCINPAVKDEVLKRAESGSPAAYALQPQPWNLAALNIARDAVYRVKSGECFSFAAAGAAIIYAQGPPRPRIELVSWTSGGTHCFVIVGREGGYRQGMLAQGRPKWGDDWGIVDPWAAAMGYESVYYRGAGYPYGSMLWPLELIMEYPGD